MRSAPWMLVAMTFATALVAGVALALATDEWILLPAALLVHFLGTAVVMGVTGKALTQQTKPDPVAEARQDEEGVRGTREQESEDPKPVI
jgi:hypothetical protein